MKTKRLTLKLYRDRRREFRWTLTASNGHIIAEDGEGYQRRRFMEKAVLTALCGAEPFPPDLCQIADVRPDIIVSDETIKGK